MKATGKWGDPGAGGSSILQKPASNPNWNSSSTIRRKHLPPADLAWEWTGVPSLVPLHEAVCPIFLPPKLSVTFSPDSPTCKHVWANLQTRKKTEEIFVDCQALEMYVPWWLFMEFANLENSHSFAVTT